MYKNDLYSDERVRRRRRRSCSIRAGVVGQLPVYALTKSANSAGARTYMVNQHCVHHKWEKMKITDTLSADLAVTVGVTGLQESGCLGGGQCAGRGREILQEKPAGGEKKKMQSTHPWRWLWRGDVQSVSLQLVFLDEPALVLVDDVEGLLQLLRGLSSQPTGGEELLVVEWAIGYNQYRKRKKLK